VWRFDFFSRRSPIHFKFIRSKCLIAGLNTGEESQQQAASRLISPHGMLAFFCALIFVPSKPFFSIYVRKAALTPNKQ